MSLNAATALLGVLFCAQLTLAADADPTQLPIANRQLPNWDAYEALGMPARPANYRYADPATGAMVTKVTSAAVPLVFGENNADALHDYAEGGPLISREWGNGQHTILIRASRLHPDGYTLTETWLADYQRGVGATNWRPFPTGLGGYPSVDLSASFSNVAATARILFFVDNGKLFRFDTEDMALEPETHIPNGVIDIPGATGDYMYWLQSSKDDEWLVFQFCPGTINCAVPTVFAFNRQTGALHSRPFPNSNEPHLDRDGNYVLILDGGGGECGQGQQFEYFWHLWNLDTPAVPPACKGPIYTGHVAWMRGYFVQSDPGPSWHPNFYYDPVADSATYNTHYADPKAFLPSHHAGQWIQNVADTTQWYWGSSYKDGEARVLNNAINPFCPGQSAGWSLHSGQIYKGLICWAPMYQKPLIGVRAVYQTAAADPNRLSQNLTQATSVAAMTEGSFFHDVVDPANYDDDQLYVWAKGGGSPQDRVYFYAPTPVHRGVGVRRVNGSDVRLLCHNYSWVSVDAEYNDDYYDTPFATTSPDGKVVMFTSNMGQRDGRRDVFIAEVPLETLAGSETTTTGSICAGSYLSTQSSNEMRECLLEGLVNGKAKLVHRWIFPDVPRGTQYLTFEGHRPDVPPDFPTNDDFQLYYNTTGGSIGIVIPGALINSAGESSVTVPLGLVTTAPTTIYLLIGDTNPNQSGDTQQDRVFIDHLKIKTIP